MISMFAGPFESIGQGQIVPKSACQIDLDGNGVSDIALLLQTEFGIESIVILKEGQGRPLAAFSLLATTLERGEFLELSCQHGNRVQESSVGRKLPGRTVEIPYRAYLRIGLPESSESIFYFDNGEFHRVWIRG
jgi:hypothetical protein